jgi:hypothetical protein
MMVSWRKTWTPDNWKCKHNIVTCRALIRRVLVWMIGFILSWLHTHNYTQTQRQYSAVSHLHTLQSTVAHALGFLASTRRFPETDLDAQSVSLTLQILHVNLPVTKQSSQLTPITRCELILNCSYFTGAALPSVSPINAGIQHAENAASCTVAPSSVTV